MSTKAIKNAGLGFAIPYLHNGQPHDFVPDFLIRLKTEPVEHLILETKGFDELAEVKSAAAERWVAAVNADEQFGRWRFAMVRSVEKVRAVLDDSAPRGLKTRGSISRPTSGPAAPAPETS